MQGTGNDFVIIDNRTLQLSKEEIAELAPDICSRRFGVGSDGIMALFPAEKEQVDYTMFYLNPDGSDAGMCGNGGRCMALFAYSLGFGQQQLFNVHNRIYKAKVKGNSVSLSFPIQATIEPITIDDQEIYVTHTGTEHIVTSVDAQQLTEDEFLKSKGSELRFHNRFHPVGTNVNFISGIDKTHLRLQTYERGVEDLTLACGTGAIASALVWHQVQELSNSERNKFMVVTKGGELGVHFTYDPADNSYNNVKLEGPAHFVFTGEYMH